MIELPDIASTRTRQVLTALLTFLALSGLAYWGLSVPAELVEDVIEVAVEEALAPEPEPETPAPETPAPEEAAPVLGPTETPEG